MGIADKVQGPMNGLKFSKEESLRSIASAGYQTPNNLQKEYVQTLNEKLNEAGIPCAFVDYSSLQSQKNPSFLLSLQALPINSRTNSLKDLIYGAHPHLKIEGIVSFHGGSKEEVNAVSNALYQVFVSLGYLVQPVGGELTGPTITLHEETKTPVSGNKKQPQFSVPISLGDHSLSKSRRLSDSSIVRTRGSGRHTPSNSNGVNHNPQDFYGTHD